MRITERMLELQVDRLNELTGSPMAYFDEATKKINIGHHTLSGAYGGWQLQRVTSDGGGVEALLSHGHIPKRELYNLITSYISGIEAGKGER